MNPAEEAVLLAPVNAALLAFQKTKNKVPNDLNELIVAGFLKGMPPVPPGRKIYYEPITVTVSVGNAK